MPKKRGQAVKWSAFWRNRVESEEPGMPHWVGEKTASYAFCRSLGVSIPEVYATAPSARELDFASFPDRFVIKPDGFGSNRGVHLLTRVSADSFHCAFEQREISTAELIAEYDALNVHPKRAACFKVIVEERLEQADDVGPIPFDYKVYTFYGRPRMVIQINRNIKPAGVAWFDGKFRLLRHQESLTWDEGHFQLDRALMPRGWRQMLRIARKTSLALKTPFVRVDLYDTRRGPVFGEFTMVPGGHLGAYRFLPRFDEEMGKAWRRAAARIARDGEARQEPDSRGRARRDKGQKARRR